MGRVDRLDPPSIPARRAGYDSHSIPPFGGEVGAASPPSLKLRRGSPQHPTFYDPWQLPITAAAVAAVDWIGRPALRGGL